MISAPEAPPPRRDCAHLLLLLQLLGEGVGFGLGRVELLLGGFQLLLPLRLGVLHLVLQHLVLFLRPFLHLLGDAQSLLALVWFSKHSASSWVSPGE